MTNRGNTLYHEQTLSENEYLESNNGHYFAILQYDNNFVLYKVLDF